MMTVPNPSALSLVPASKADIPSLIRIHKAAFVFDNAARLMSSSDEVYEEKLQMMLDSQMSDPKYSIIKAVNKETTIILGWLGFGLDGYADAEARASTVEAKAGTAEAKHEPSDKKANDKLRTLVQVNFTQKRNEWMSNKQHIHIGTLVTDPVHQGRGVGSALIRRATSKADADRVEYRAG